MKTFESKIYPWNEGVWQTLTSNKARSNHAFCLCGSTGLGKVDLGFALAHQLIAKESNQSEQLFNAGSHPDVHVLMPEREVLAVGEDSLLSLYAQRYLENHTGKQPRRVISIEMIRKLNEAMSTHPHISRHRFVFIPCAHALNINAANALLKSLEEPPSNTVFVLVTDEISRLPKTIRSRCSLVSFRTPPIEVSKAWVQSLAKYPEYEIDSHLAMASNQPLLAVKMLEGERVKFLKSVFNDVNSLWAQKSHAITVSKNWQTQGALEVVQVLQQLCVDMFRMQVMESPTRVFFPVQQTWVKSVSARMSQAKLISVMDEINQAKRLLATNVDELLLLESLAINVSELPNRAS